MSTKNAEHIRVVIEEDKEVTIAPAEANAVGQNMVLAPDGTIWLNTATTAPGLFKSTDQGETWTSVPVDLPDAEPNQYVAGLTVTRDGRLWIAHQSVPKVQSGGRRRL